MFSCIWVNQSEQSISERHLKFVILKETRINFFITHLIALFQLFSPALFLLKFFILFSVKDNKHLVTTIFCAVFNWVSGTLEL